MGILQDPLSSSCLVFSLRLCTSSHICELIDKRGGSDEPRYTGFFQVRDISPGFDSDGQFVPGPRLWVSPEPLKTPAKQVPGM